MKRLLLFLLLFATSTIIFCQITTGHTKCFTESPDIKDFCFTSTGASIFAADNNIVKILSSVSGEQIGLIETLHTNEILAIEVSKDSSTLVTGGKDSLLIIKDLFSGNTEVITDGTGYITSVSISADNSIMAAGYSDGSVIVYNLVESKVIYTIKENFSFITMVEFSPDCTLLAISGAGPESLLFNVKNGNIHMRIPGHKGWTRSITFNMDSEKVITCGDDSMAVIYDIAKYIVPYEIKRTRLWPSWVIGASYLSDNKSVVYATMNGKILVETIFNSETINLKSIIYKLHVMPRNDDYIRIAVSVKGEGILLINPNSFN